MRQAGLIVYSIAEESPSIKDTFVLSAAVDRKALLIIEDKDFGELVFRLQLPHYGILLIRITNTSNKIFLAETAVKQYYNDLIRKFSVINNNNLESKNRSLSRPLLGCM